MSVTAACGSMFGVKSPWLGKAGAQAGWLVVIGAAQAVRNFTVKFRSRARRIVPLYDLVPRADAKWAGNGLVMGWPYLGVV